MSAVESAEYTLRKTTAPTGGYFIDAAKDMGLVRIVPFSYTAASLATASTIALLDVKVGDTVFGVFLTNAALGSPTTLAVGDTASSTRYMAATNGATAGTMVGYIAGYTYTAADTVIITTSGTTVGAIAGFLLVSLNAGH